MYVRREEAIAAQSSEREDAGQLAALAKNVLKSAGRIDSVHVLCVCMFWSACLIRMITETSTLVCLIDQYVVEAEDM